jgi:hypothetical protein
MRERSEVRPADVLSPESRFLANVRADAPSFELAMAGALYDRGYPIDILSMPYDPFYSDSGRFVLSSPKPALSLWIEGEVNLGSVKRIMLNISQASVFDLDLGYSRLISDSLHGIVKDTYLMVDVSRPAPLYLDDGEPEALFLLGACMKFDYPSGDPRIASTIPVLRPTMAEVVKKRAELIESGFEPTSEEVIEEVLAKSVDALTKREPYLEPRA